MRREFFCIRWSNDQPSEKVEQASFWENALGNISEACQEQIWEATNVPWWDVEEGPWWIPQKTKYLWYSPNWSPSYLNRRPGADEVPWGWWAFYTTFPPPRLQVISGDTSDLTSPLSLAFVYFDSFLPWILASCSYSVPGLPWVCGLNCHPKIMLNRSFCRSQRRCRKTNENSCCAPRILACLSKKDE